MSGSSPFDLGLVAVDTGSAAAAVPVVASTADYIDDDVVFGPAVAAPVVVAVAAVVVACTDYSVDSSAAD